MSDRHRGGDFLIVDDEAGIREGLASFVRLRGHRVRTAECVADALALLAAERFDAVVTDWRLGDEAALAVVESARRAGTRCFVMSGHPDEVMEALGARRDEGEQQDRHETLEDPRVLAKPLLPKVLVEMLEGCLSDVDPGEAEAELSAPRGATALPQLPVDTAARVDLVARACGGAIEVHDDGSFVTVRGRLPSDEILDDVALLGGDLRVLRPENESLLEIRFYRDSRPDGVQDVIRRGDPWPAGDRPFAIDLDGDGACGPREFDAMLETVEIERATGREVHLLNVPDSLRIWLETLGASARVPMRREAGPRLPEVVAQLWS